MGSAGWTVERWRTIAGLEQCFGDRSEPPPPGVRTLRQVHGRTVHAARDVQSTVTEGDGLATDESGLSVGIWTADCVPVHLVAPSARVAVAVHCGWRGSAAGILPAAFDLLARHWSVRPGDVEAALGPSIGGCCYEVGDEVADAFVARSGRALGGTGFEHRDGRLYLNLRTFLVAELRSLGVVHAERVGPCTACRPDVLYSYRKGSGKGRQLSWVGWRDA